MPEFQLHTAQSEGTVEIHFRVEATADEVIARLLEAVRRTDLSLLTVVGDELRVYPFEGRNETRLASEWYAELLWRGADTSDLGWHWEVFVRRAELFLHGPVGFVWGRQDADGFPERRSSGEGPAALMGR